MNALDELSFETLNQIKNRVREAYAGNNGEIRRDITTGSGLTFIDLQHPSKSIVPVITPLLNMTPRVPGTGDTQTTWRVVTGFNTARIRPGVPGGVRAARNTTATATKHAAYATLGGEDSVTIEANLAAQEFEDIRATTAMRLVYATKLGEELVLLGGNQSTLLGTPGTVTVNDVGTGGSLLHAQAYYVNVVALTVEGWDYAVANNAVPDLQSLTSPVGEAIAYGGGSSQRSQGTVTTANDANDTHKLTCSVPPVSGAVAYAWFIGTASGAGRFYTVTTINSVVITSAPVTGQQVSAITGDNSVNAYEFDGLIPQAIANGYFVQLATGTLGTGTPLTSDNAGGINEITAMFKSIFDNTRISPRFLVASSQEWSNIYKKVVAGGSAPLFRFNIDASSNTTEVQAGRVIGTFLNPFVAGGGGQSVKLVLHPNMPAGTMMALTDMAPSVYIPSSNLGNLWELHVQQDYYQEEWPMRTRSYETGVYCREVLAHYFPQTMGIITNIGNG